MYSAIESVFVLEADYFVLGTRAAQDGTIALSLGRVLCPQMFAVGIERPTALSGIVSTLHTLILNITVSLLEV